MRRITPRTCLWPLVGVLCATFALSIGLTYRSDHHCYAGTCGEWLFPFQARLHVVVWYAWISLSVTVLGFRAFQPSVRNILSTPFGVKVPLLGKELRVGGVLVVLWICSLYGILVGIWWIRLSGYFEERGRGLSGNNLLAAIAQTGHLADVSMGMVLLPVSRHSALASFFKLSPTTTFTFHIAMAHVLFALIITHGSLYAAWVAMYNQDRALFRKIFPVLNPTYLTGETWPGKTSSLGIWRASLIFTGSVSSLIMLAMFLTSFPVVRRKHFNLFYFTHLLAIVAVVVICLHASTMFYCTIPGLSMWLLDWGMRVFELREKLDSRLDALGRGWFSLTLPLPRKRLSGCACHSPLAHFYIHHTESSIREIHPFTTITHLASQKRVVQDGEEIISIRFLFKQAQRKDSPQVLGEKPAKKSKQWTNKLASLIDEERAETTPAHLAVSTAVRDNGVDTTLRMEGPYFTPANPELFRNVVCLVAGTGLSGALAIAAAFKAYRAGYPTAESAPSPTVGEPFKSETELAGHWQRCIVVWIVREDDFVDMPFFHNLNVDGLEIQVYKTGGGRPRPDMSKMLVESCGQEGKDSWCYISGPGGFITAAEQSCNNMKSLRWFAARWD